MSHHHTHVTSSYIYVTSSPGYTTSTYTHSSAYTYIYHPYTSHTTPMHTYTTPIHTYNTPIHTYTTPIHTLETPIHTYTTPIHTHIQIYFFHTTTQNNTAEILSGQSFLAHPHTQAVSRTLRSQSQRGLGWVRSLRTSGPHETRRRTVSIRASFPHEQVSFAMKVALTFAALCRRQNFGLRSSTRREETIRCCCGCAARTLWTGEWTCPGFLLSLTRGSSCIPP